MILTIYSLKGIQYQGEAASFNVKTKSGEITVLDRHRPLITVLTKGEAIITAGDGAKITLPISSGFLEMNGENELSVLAR